jgi:hypothetical protein
MPKKLIEASRQKALKKRLDFIIHKAYTLSGDDFTLEDVENSDDWLAVIDFTDEERSVFIDQIFYYMKRNGCMYPFFELERTKYFNPYKSALVRYCAEILVDEILKFNHEHFK